MEKAAAYLISVGVICFGLWIVAVATVELDSSIIWIVSGLISGAVGLVSLFGEIRNDKAT